MKVLLLDQIAKVNYKYSFSLANAIKDCGVDIDLAIDLKSEKENCKCNIYNYFNTDEKNISIINKGFNYIDSFGKIVKKIKKEKYDIVHTQWIIFSPLDYYYLKKLKKAGKKIVMTVHDILPFNEKIYDRYFHKKIYELADNIIVQAETNVNRFGELFPELSNKVIMIPHGHFLDYAEVLDQKIARESLKLPKDKFIVLFFGQIKKVKGIGNLLEAFAKLPPQYKDIHLVIAGNIWKDDFSNYQKIISENKMADRVTTDIKYISDDDVKYYYSACDVAALPYTDVYQSGVIQLAYSYKKSVISTKLPAFTPIVKENVTGFLSEVHNSESLKNAIIKAYENKDDLNAMGQAGYDLIAKKYAWKDIANTLFAIYKNL